MHLLLRSTVISLAFYCCLNKKVFASNILRSSCRSNALFYHIGSNIKVNATALMTFTVKHIDECLGSCLLHPSCASINVYFAFHLKNCSLFKEDRKSGSISLLQEEGYHYYDTGEPSDKIGPYCRDTRELCPEEKCIDSCSLRHKCVPFSGSSCYDIRNQYKHITLKSKMFPVMVNETSYNVFCDMDTAGGGWMLIGKVDIIHQSQTAISEATADQILQNISGNFVPTIQAFRVLRKMFGFSQLRFYCYKSRANKTLHIYTAANQSGKVVLDYMSGKVSVAPVACGSFEMLPEDNAILSRQCWKWGKPNNKNTWWSQRFMYHPMAIYGQRHYGYVYNRRECDDFSNILPYDIRGTWHIYAR